MAQKRIVWSKTARADFKATLLFYKERNGNSTYSKRLANEITTLIELLPKNNFLGKVTTVSGVRVIVRKPFSIFYEVKEAEILILMVWDARRSSEELEKYLI